MRHSQVHRMDDVGEEARFWRRDSFGRFPPAKNDGFCHRLFGGRGRNDQHAAGKALFPQRDRMTGETRIRVDFVNVDSGHGF